MATINTSHLKGEVQNSVQSNQHLIMKTIEFQMHGEGPVLRIQVSFLQFFGDLFVFRCKPGQDPIWKNMKGGVQCRVQSNLRVL